MDKKKKNWQKYGITAGVALAITALVVWYEISEYGFSRMNMIHFLCDGFFVTAILLLGMGVMVWIAGLGGFNGMKYIFYSVANIFSPKNNKFEARKSYYDFLKEQEKKEKSDNRHLIVAGCIWILISLLFLIVFEMYD
jgi:hypothetical protein